jgi:hypothetical protein
MSSSDTNIDEFELTRHSTAVEKLEALLKTKYHEHVHVETGEVHVACDE